MTERHFDLTFIVPASADESEDVQGVVAGVKAMLEANGATIQWEDTLGKRKFTYPIKHQNYGHYFTFVFSAEGENVNKIEHELRLNAEVLRYLLAKMDPKTNEELEADKEERGEYSKRAAEKEAEEEERRSRRDDRRGKRGDKGRSGARSGVKLDEVPVKKEKVEDEKEEKPAEKPAETPEETPAEKPEEKKEETPVKEEAPVEVAEEKPAEKPAETPEEKVEETAAEEPKEEKKVEEKVELSDLDTDKLDEILDKEIDI